MTSNITPPPPSSNELDVELMILLLLVSLSLADHRVPAQHAWVRIVNLIEPDGLFTNVPLRSVVLHNPQHENKVQALVNIGFRVITLLNVK